MKILVLFITMFVLFGCAVENLGSVSGALPMPTPTPSETEQPDLPPLNPPPECVCKCRERAISVKDWNTKEVDCAKGLETYEVGSEKVTERYDCDALPESCGNIECAGQFINSGGDSLECP